MEEQATGASGPNAKNNFAVMALKELSKVDKGLEKLTQTYANVVYDVATTKGMDQAKKARQAIRDVRYKVEHIRKEEASRIKAAQTALNNEAERIKNAILVIETPIDAQISAEEERKQREKEEAERKEQERIAQIRAEIDRLAGAPARAEADGLSIDEINSIISALGGSRLDGYFYKEFLAEAEHTQAKVINELHTLAAKIKLRQEEAQRVAAQAAEIEELRRQLAAAQALLATKADTPAAPVLSAAVDVGLSVAADLQQSQAGVIESLHRGQPIDPTTESWSAQEGLADDVPFDSLPPAGAISSGIVEEADRLFNDECPSADRVVLAVSTHFGVDDETAKRYIVAAAEELSFGGI